MTEKEALKMSGFCIRKKCIKAKSQCFNKHSESEFPDLSLYKKFAVAHWEVFGDRSAVCKTFAACKL
jgi:hypothetical protein